MLTLKELLRCRPVTAEWLQSAIRDEQKRLWRMQETIQQDLNTLDHIQSQL